MNTSKVVGLVLAGGKSSRMGTDKSYLIFQNEMLLVRAYNCLSATKVSSVFISGTHSNYTCIKDKWPDSGPAAAILSAALRSEIKNAEYLLVIPVDMPLLSADQLIALMAAMKDKHIEASFTEGHQLPCCIKISALKNLVGTYQDQPNISMKKLLTERLLYKILPKAIADDKCFLNVNTPNEFSDLRMQYET